MKRILIINLEKSERSLYSCVVAQSLVKLNNHIKVTLVCSGSSDIFRTTGLFENIIQINKSEYNLETQKKLSTDWPILFTQEWNYIINLSGDKVSEVIAGCLRGDETFGPVMKMDKGIKIIHNNFYSLLLSATDNEIQSFFHPLQLYRGVLEHYDPDYKIEFRWDEKQKKQMIDRMQSLRQQSGKDKIVLIDAQLFGDTPSDRFTLFMELIKVLNSSKNLLPVIVADDTETKTYLVDQLRNLNEGEIYFISSTERTHLCLVLESDLIITPRSQLKTIADLAQKPSIFVFDNELDIFSQFSVINGSMAIAGQSLDKINWTDCINGLLTQSLPMADIQVGGYVSLGGEDYPRLESLGKTTSPEYLKWVCYHNFLSKVHNRERYKIKFDQKSYNNFILAEKQKIKIAFLALLDSIKKEGASSVGDNEKLAMLESHGGILFLGIKLVLMKESGNVEKNLLEKLKPIVKYMQEFLDEEILPNQSEVELN